MLAGAGGAALPEGGFAVEEAGAGEAAVVAIVARRGAATWEERRMFGLHQSIKDRETGDL